MIRAADAAGIFLSGVSVKNDGFRDAMRKEVPLIWLIAGEPSGDLIGARRSWRYGSARVGT